MMNSRDASAFPQRGGQSPPIRSKERRCPWRCFPAVLPDGMEWRPCSGRSRSSWVWRAVVLAANGVVFLVAWELMALSSFALVAADHEQHSVRQAALIYLGATRVGTAFLMAGFLWAHQLTGTWEFARWTLAGPSALGPA